MPVSTLLMFISCLFVAETLLVAFVTVLPDNSREMQFAAQIQSNGIMLSQNQFELHLKVFTNKWQSDGVKVKR